MPATMKAGRFKCRVSPGRYWGWWVEIAQVSTGRVVWKGWRLTREGAGLAIERRFAK